MNEEQEKEILNEAKIQTARHKKKIQIISLVAIIAVIAMATVACIPLIKALHSKAGIAALERKLDNYSGIVGVLIFTFIQALQVVIAVIPPIQVVGGVLFGWFWGGLLSFLGTLLGTMAIFVLVKKFGRPIVEAFVDEKQLKKFKFLQNEKKITVILIILYLIPGIPKDVISYIVPLTPISKKDFFYYVMPCRLPAIMLSTILGSNVKSGNFTVVLVVLGVALVAGIVGFLFKDVIVNKMKQHNKNK